MKLNQRPILENIRNQELLQPQSYFLPFFKKCKIRILIVTDNASFAPFGGFRLSEIIRFLETSPASYVTFEITTAHRGTDATADIDNFTFTNSSLDDFSQVWLIGVNRTGTNALSASELKALSEFMNKGGGVFGNGDHEDLGNAMCGEVLRVRSMRRWHWPTQGPNGEPKAPGTTSLDDVIHTVTDDPSTPLIENNQSDKVPQKINIKYYTARQGIFRLVKYPHPILCSTHGIIDIMPDHQHEGVCEVPSDLNKAWDFNGTNFTEYPSKGGHQESPEVIACGINNDNNQEFGMIATYNGHNVDVGRVVVDSTWHHWFDVNMMGFRTCEMSVKLAIMNGNTPDPSEVEVMEKYELMKDYFRNIAIWLAPPKLQSCIRRRGLLFVFCIPDVKILLGAKKGKKDLAYYYKVGTVAKDSLQRLAPQCQIIQWICWFIKDLQIAKEFDPFPRAAKRSNRLKVNAFPLLETDAALTAALGGAIQAAHANLNLDKFLDDNEIDNQTLDDMLSKGAHQGMEAFNNQIKKSTKNFDNLFKL